MGRGFFIALEGIEGTGKSTHSRMLAEALRASGREVVQTAEPGGTPIGRKIRALVMDEANPEMDPVAELLLYLASRRQHVVEVIRPALEAGSVVITDRFSDSTVAYQGHARGLGADFVKDAGRIATGGLAPDLTLLLDIDVREGLGRNSRAGKRDRFELEDLTFHEKVRAGFHEIHREEPARVVLIDASASVDAVHAAMIKEVLARLDS